MPLQINRVIIGGANIAGSTAAIRLAQAGKEVVLVDPKNIAEVRIPPCDGCGGLVQEITVQELADIGFPIPDSIIRRRLDAYMVHLPTGETIRLKTDLIAVHRGHGPKTGIQHPGLDSFLFNSARNFDNVRFIQDEVTDVEIGREGKARVHLKKNKVEEGDFFVAAVGHDPDLIKNHIIIPPGYSLDAPEIQKSSVNEICIGETDLENYFGDAAHVVVVPLKEAKEKLNVWFAAFIPKSHGTVTMVLMGVRDIVPDDIEQFMKSKYVKNLLPSRVLQNSMWKKSVVHGGCSQCSCIKNTITVVPPHNYLIPIQGGTTLIGDSGRTRMYKDGIGAAIRSAMMNAEAIITGDFNKLIRNMDHLYPHNDYIYAHLLMKLNDAVINHLISRKALIAGQYIPGFSQLIHAQMLHLLTGDTPYQNILPEVINRALMLAFHD